MDRTEPAWAAGFWDGEGSVYLTGSLERATRQPQARINQSSVSGVPDVLLRFQRAVGVGAIGGPETDPGREPLYRWVAWRKADIASVRDLLWPWLGHVKRTQFLEVLGHEGILGVIAVQDFPREEQVAWAGGLWDGEGCVSLMAHRTHLGLSILEASITQSSDQGTPEVLERFRAIVGAGRIYGPYDAGPERQAVYRWKLLPTDKIREVIDQIKGQIGPVKSRQAEERLAQVLAQPALPRGNPAWGDRKTQCIRGHEYATARLRPFRGRGANTEPPRASKQCLVCVREAARERRESKHERRRKRRRS